MNEKKKYVFRSGVYFFYIYINFHFYKSCKNSIKKSHGKWIITVESNDLNIIHVFHPHLHYGILMVHENKCDPMYKGCDYV